MNLNLYFELTNKFNVTPLKISIMNHLQPGKVAFLKIWLIVSLTLSFLLTSNAQTTAPKTKQVVSPTTVQSKAVTTPAKAAKENVKNVSSEGVQNPAKSKLGTPPSKKIYPFLEVMPQFPGGDRELLNFVRSNLRYPLAALQNNIRGRVITRFVVNELGKVETPEILKSIDPSLDKEALRVVSSLPDFTPGELKGKKVAVWYTLPINFRPEEQDNTRTININDFEGKKMVFLADGNEISYEDMKKIDPKNIESIEIVKDAASLGQYGDKANDGIFKMKLKK
jgi:TonB family protein